MNVPRRETRTHESDVGILEHLMAQGEMVPAQLAAPSNWTPERRLAAAVFASALVEVRDHVGERKYRRKIAEDLEWIESEERDWPFSFLRICDLFSLEPCWVRSVVRFWTSEPNIFSRRTFSTFRQAA
jgi:hypothetical protein